MKTNSLVHFYKVNDSDHPVKLEVEVGHGQNSNSKILLNHLPVPGPGPEGSFVRSFELILGTNKELQGEELLMTTVVHDIMENTNMTSLTISLTGGVKPYTKTLEHSASKKGEVVTYSANIEFFK